jgi:mannose-6-phosphate isomerase
MSSDEETVAEPSTTAQTLAQRLFLLEPQYRERVWGGRRLKPSQPPVGEAWVAFGESRVAEGAHAGRTISELAGRYSAQLLGAEVFARFGERFPLLVKLLDCADWLSVQVHPDDEQARRLVGPDACGKTEAWHILEAEPGATIYAGVKAGTTREALGRAVREGRVLDVAERSEVREGETVYIPSGTLHTLGPGLLLYEVQQASDTTFRVYDWGRPAAAGRKLHIEESLAVINLQSGVVFQPPPELHGTAAARAVSCTFFDLDVLQIAGDAFEGDTSGRAFHLLTAADGAVELSCGGETARLGRFATALVAGGAGPYELRAAGGPSRVLRASVPPPDTR